MGTNPISQLTIGRSRRSDIRVDHSSVSRRHATLRIGSDGTLQLCDERSRNGTYVRARNGTWDRISERDVQMSTRIRLGAHSTTVAGLINRLPADFPPIRVLAERDAGRGRTLPHRNRLGAHLLVVTEGSRKRRLKKPRRNAATGLIEDISEKE